ncbi:MAG: hypothetical protein K2M89_03525 [Clostridiales bacterium]|nr:hypothetical protein [Clostridiales bacterium]
MISDKCKACGARLNTAFYQCPECGAKRSDDELLQSAEIAYNAEDSDAARRFYKSILARDRKNAEAYWGLFLLDHGVKDGIMNEGLFKVRVTAENYLAMNLTEELYDSIVLDENFLRAVNLAEGDFKKRVHSFRDWLDERLGELEKERTDAKFKERTDAVRDMFTPPQQQQQEQKSETFDPYAAAYETHKKSSNSKSNGAKTTPKKGTQTTKPKSGAAKSKTTAKSTASASRKPIIFAGDIVLTVVCCIPIILELLLVLLIPHISFLAKIDGVAKWGWNALSVPMKVSFISVIVFGFLVQTLGLLDKLNKPLGAVTQIITFGLFVLSVFAAHNNATSVYTQWGMAIMVPISLLVTAFRYVTCDGFGFLDDFNFWFYLPIALEVIEYLLFFLVFPLMFGVSASLWAFVALTVTTIAAIAVSSFWEDFRWIAAGINLAVVVLLCVIFWLGRLWNSEWLWNGGIITVVILAIGGSWFIHWFIHRNDDEKWKS